MRRAEHRGPEGGDQALNVVEDQVVVLDVKEAGGRV